MKKIVVVGGGGHAKVIISILKKNKNWRILGYTDNSDKGVILGIKFLGKDDILLNLIKQNPDCNAVIGIGKTDINDKRLEIFKKTKSIGFKLPPIISSTATVNEDVSFDEGTVVFDGCIINSGSKIGKINIINTNSVIEHDCTTNDNVFIGPSATLCGQVKIDKNSFVGAGATVIQNISINKNCLIGAGSLIIKDIINPGIYVGNPGKFIKL